MSEPKKDEPIGLRATTFFVAPNDPFEAKIAKAWVEKRFGAESKANKRVEVPIARLTPECHVITLVRRGQRTPATKRWKNPENDSYEFRQIPPEECIGEITPSEPIPMSKFYRDTAVDQFGETERELDRVAFLAELGSKAIPSGVFWNPDQKPGIFYLTPP